MVTIPPDVVRMRASSTVFAKASSLVNRDLAGILSSVSMNDRSLFGIWYQVLFFSQEKKQSGHLFLRYQSVG